MYQAALGYNQSNAESLIRQIDVSIKTGEAKMHSIDLNDHGITFGFTTNVTGPNGNTKSVVSKYIIEFKSNHPRMTTNYVK